MINLNFVISLYIYIYIYWNICIFWFRGFGQDSSTPLNLGSFLSVDYKAILDSFKRVGFANATLGFAILLPCPLGTFVNESRLECVECPAGKMVPAHSGQSNFSFFQQKRKKELVLILIMFTYFKVQKKKMEKRKRWGKSIIFFIF